MSDKREDKKKSEKVIKETVAEYTVTERASVTKATRGTEKASGRKPSNTSSSPLELEPWERPLDSYTDEELEALYADYGEEARLLAEVGIAEYAQHLSELDKV